MNESHKERSSDPGGVNYSCHLFPSVTPDNSATTMITGHVILGEVGSMLGEFGQADGAIVEATMGTTDIVMAIDIFAEQVHQVLVAEDREVVQALGFEGLHERLGVAVHFWNPDGALHHLDALALHDIVESAAVAVVVIADEVLGFHAEVMQMHAEVSGLLGYPVSIGIWRCTGDIDLTRADVLEEEGVVILPTERRLDLLGEEVAGPHGVGVRFDELVPGAMSTIRLGIIAVSTHDVADGGARDLFAQTELPQFAVDAGVQRQLGRPISDN